MRVQANLQRIVLNPNQLPLLDAWVKDAVEGAAKAWVRAAVEKVPVWSGASRATFQALASAVNEHIEIDLSSTAPDRIGLGRVYSRGGVEKVAPGHWRFFYETSLRYLITNETRRVAPRTEGLRGKLITPTPYEFREAGNAAAKAYLATLEIPLLDLEGRPL